MGAHHRTKVTPGIHSRIKAPSGIRRKMNREEIASSSEEDLDLDIQAQALRIIESLGGLTPEEAVGRIFPSPGDSEDVKIASLKVEVARRMIAVVADLKETYQRPTSQVIKK